MKNKQKHQKISFVSHSSDLGHVLIFKVVTDKLARYDHDCFKPIMIHHLKLGRGQPP